MVDGTSDLDTNALLRRLQKLDPYSAYVPPHKSSDSRSVDGQIQGVGIQLFAHKGKLLVVPYPGGPSFNSGLTRRSYLLQVDGVRVEGENLEQVAERLRGEQESEVVLQVQTPDRGITRSYRVIRQNFQVPNVSYVKEEGVPILRVWGFESRRTRELIRRGLERLLNQSEPVVIDLRNAQGGDLFEALDCASLFVDGGLSVGGISDREGMKRDYRTLPGMRLVKQTVTLLVSQSTASAAEAFARALQLHKAALLVGEPTYGKCVTQTLVNLSNGALLKFSNGKLLGPSGAACDPDGLQPDVRIPGAEEKSASQLINGIY